MTMTEHVFQISAPKTVGFVPRESQALEPNQVRLKTIFSGISAGTELTQYRGQNPFLEKRWDDDSLMFLPGTPSSAYPLHGVGYEQVGEVIELGLGVTKLEIGQVVWGSWGHATHTVQDEAEVCNHLVDPNLNPMLAVFARIGGIALNPVLDADIHLGETVAVFGLGVPGLLAAQMARLSGANVIAIDGITKRLGLAKSLGLTVHDFREGSAAEHIKAITNNRGADVTIELTGSYRALHEAIRSTAYNSRVIVAGFMPGEGIGLALGEEFHHNRIELVCSQISGVGSRVAHRWNRLRLEQTVMQHAGKGLQLEPLISHVFKPKDVVQAYKLLDENPAEAVQVVLDFRDGV